MPYQTLGKFLTVYEKDDVRFYLRGLNVGEYVDLIEKTDDNQVSQSLLIEIAECGIVNWENFYHGNDFKKIECTKENIQRIDKKTMVELGSYIYQELTVLSEEEKDKFEAFVHFLYWSSDDENKNKVKSFECESCLETGKAVRRPCGKYDMKYRKKMAGKDVSEDSKGDEEEEEVSEQDYLDAMSRYSSKKNIGSGQSTKKSREETKQEKSGQRKKFVKIGDYKLDECPISYIDDWIKTLGEALYNCEKSDRTFFDGGISNQRYKIYKASSIVKSTFNKIEKKELEDEHDTDT
jgi:hypothetical protein